MVHGVNGTNVGCSANPARGNARPRAENPRACALYRVFEHGIVHRFHRAGDKQAAGIAQLRQMRVVLQQMLDLDGDVVAELREFAVQRLDNGQRVRRAIEKIGIAEA